MWGRNAGARAGAMIHLTLYSKQHMVNPYVPLHEVIRCIRQFHR